MKLYHRLVGKKDTLLMNEMVEETRPIQRCSSEREPQLSVVYTDDSFILQPQGFRTPPQSSHYLLFQ